MRKFVSILSIIVLAMVSLGTSLSAQDASTPEAPMGPPESFEIAPGVTADHMVFPEGSQEPSSYRLTFDAGITYEIAASPNLEVGYMESGSLVMTVDQSVTVKQVDDLEGEGDTYSAGTEFTIEAGQFMVMQPGATGEIRNDTDAPAVISIAGLVPAAPGMATPAASPQG